MNRRTAQWKNRETIRLDRLQVTLSEPVLVKRSRSYCWFPSLIRLANGHVWAVRLTVKKQEPL